MKKVKTLWKTEIEFYDMHSKEIFSKFPFYHTTIIGNTEEEIIKYIIERTDINKNSIVLDLGCGSGYLVNELRKICKKSIGISSSYECIKQARINYPESIYKTGNMESFVFKNITHALSLESIGYSDLKKTLKQTFKNLQTNGIFYVKDIFRKNKETKKEKENRIYNEKYWKYTHNKLVVFLEEALNAGFDLLEYRDISELTNNEMYLKTLELNKTPFKIPHKNISYLIPVEIILKK